MHTTYTNSIEDGIAVMALYGDIGSPGWEAERFTNEMKFHNSMGSKIKVYINSGGGSVFGGYALIQAIIDYGADTHIVGLAASMAGIIAQFGKTRTMNDFGVGMIHMPNGTDNGKLLDIVSASLLDILKERSTKSEEELSELMKAETFFDASEMLSAGLIDEIVTTSRSAPKISGLSTNDLFNIYNNILIEENMKKLKAHFELPDTSTEINILDKVTGLENAISTHKEDISAKDAEIASIKAELETLRSENTTLNDELAMQIVTDAVEAGKIEKAKKDIWIDAAKKDPKGTKAQLESISKVVNSSVQTTVINGKGSISKPEDDIVAWVKSPEGGKKLIELFNDDQDEYERLWNLYETKLEIKK